MTLTTKFLIGAFSATIALCGYLFMEDGFQSASAEYQKGNIEKARELYEKACNKGNAQSCTIMGNMYIIGDSNLTRDYTKAVIFLTKACDGDDAEGCSLMGTLHLNGQGVEKNVSKSVQLYQKSCDKENPISCARLGMIYKEGQELKQDITKAKEFLSKACNQNLTRACEEYKNIDN